MVTGERLAMDENWQEREGEGLQETFHYKLFYILNPVSVLPIEKF